MTTTEIAAATLDRFDRAWADLDGTVRSLAEGEMTEIRNEAGWTAKDHLMHVAAWEQALHARLDGRPRAQVLGIDPAADGSGEDDVINAAIFEATRRRPLAEVLTILRATYAQTRGRLAALAGEGTVGAAGALPDAETARVLLAEVPGFAEHYEQHARWIRELVGGL